MFLRVTKDLIQSEDFTDDNIKKQSWKQLKKYQIDEVRCIQRCGIMWVNHWVDIGLKFFPNIFCVLIF